MPYKTNKNLPPKVSNNLPKKAQTIYRKAYNAAHEEYQKRSNIEELAARVAWSAVKKKYKKNESGKWVKK